MLKGDQATRKTRWRGWPLVRSPSLATRRHGTPWIITQETAARWIRWKEKWDGLLHNRQQVIMAKTESDETRATLPPPPRILTTTRQEVTPSRRAKRIMRRSGMLSLSSSSNKELKSAWFSQPQVQVCVRCNPKKLAETTYTPTPPLSRQN